MAMYPTMPYKRMAYDTDGSVVFQFSSYNYAVSTVSSANARVLNGEHLLNRTIIEFLDGYDFYFGVVFPQNRDVSGVFLSYNDWYGLGDVTATMSYSLDTTNGLDGEWTATGYTFPGQGLYPDYRTEITPTGLTNVKAVRFSGYFDISVSQSEYLACMHLYGTTTFSDALQIRYSSSDKVLAASSFDFGDKARSTSTVRPFRVKNVSSQTANNVLIGADVPSDPNTPTTASMLTFSTDSDNYTSTITLASLAPGALSSTLYVKVAPAATQPLLARAFRVTATAGSWT